MYIDDLLKKMVALKGSDLFITKGIPPMLKVNDEHIELDPMVLERADIEALLQQILTSEQNETFKKEKELEYAVEWPGAGRFRVSVFQQKSEFGAVLRRIEARIPSLEELQVPSILGSLVMQKRGLIIVVGATGAGKSSTLAAMIGYRNQNASGHIVTIEDPIEYIHEHQKSIITQREVGIDTLSLERGLRNSLRQAPDLALIGEIRTQEQMRFALAFAETGHLCLATMHANNADQALERIAHLYPQDLQRQLGLELSLNLKAIIAQQLVPSLDGKSRLPAVEILINTPIVADIIHKWEINRLKEIMGKSQEAGMQTFDQGLYDLYLNKKISYESALKYADSENEVRLMIKLNPQTQKKTGNPPSNFSPSVR